MVPLKTLIRNMKAKERNKEETKENDGQSIIHCIKNHTYLNWLSTMSDFLTKHAPRLLVGLIIDLGEMSWISAMARPYR